MNEPATGFNTVVIVGVGLIGGSLGLAIRRAYPGTRVIGISSRAAVESARDIGAITEGYGYEELVDVAGSADLILLCTPIHRIMGLIRILAPVIREGAIVSDVGSTKRAVTTLAAEVFPDHAHFIGGHPMAGAESRGVSASDPFLFQNAIYVLCPVNGVPTPVVEGFRRYIGGIGATVMVMDAATHDRIAAAVSHLPQLLAVALVEMVGRLNGDSAPYLRLAAGGFRDMTRIASSSFSMWDDIYRTNTDVVRDSVDRFIEELTLIRDSIGSAELGEHFEIANITRGNIPRDTKGFISTLSEVLVVVEDKPGEIARIAGILARQEINIKDIEVLKVREGEGGTIRLAFESRDAAGAAVSLLAETGYTARIRG